MAPVGVLGRPSGDPSYGRELGSVIWLIAVAGLVAGPVIGALLRIAMLLLRLVSPGSSGLLSDDGFEIGVVTLAGTYNLVMLGVGLGLLGASAYVLVAPFLVGRRWFRRLTVALTAMFLGGATTIHDDGVDFNLLDPEAAVALFLLVPLVSGVVVVVAVDALDRRVSSPTWAPVGLVLFPVALVLGLVLAALAAVLLPLRRMALEPILARAPARWLVRLAFAATPVLALVWTIRQSRLVLE